MRPMLWRPISALAWLGVRATMYTCELMAKVSRLFICTDVYAGGRRAGLNHVQAKGLVALVLCRVKESEAAKDMAVLAIAQARVQDKAEQLRSDMRATGWRGNVEKV